MQMDVRDMSKFSDESFDCAIDKGMSFFRLHWILVITESIHARA